MATIAEPLTGSERDDSFFLKLAVAMALTIVAGFVLQLAAGRSSFAAPLLVHAHAVVFFGWVAIFVTQAALVAQGRIALHRALGWIAVGWMVAMVILGTWVTVAMVRRGAAPFFFTPGFFLVMNPATVIAFAGLTIAAVRLRRRTDWHRRLHVAGMAILTGPAFGRLIPLPLLIPYSYYWTFAATLVFPLAGMIADLRRHGRVHPAWWWGLGTMAATLAVIELVVGSPIGAAVYDAAVAGSPAAAIDGFAYPPPPLP